MQRFLFASLIVAAAACWLTTTAQAYRPAPCSPGYVRVPGGPCRLDVLPTNRFKALKKAARSGDGRR